MMEAWQRELSKSVTNAEALAKQFGVDVEALGPVHREYPMRITPHYLRLMQERGDPIWRQVVPDREELEDDEGVDDPLAEDTMSPAPNLTHRYPDRVLLLVTHQCAIYCRFCTRKRKVGKLPYISNIPIIGFLFRGNSRTVSQSSLLIFVTPDIIDTTGARFFDISDQ